MNPYRRQHLRMTMGLGLSALALTPAWGLGAEASVSDGALREASERLNWRERSLIGFGTTLWLRAADPSADRAEAALDQAVHSLRAIEGQMSLFDEHSALSRLNRSGTLNQPTPDLLKVLKLSSHISARSGGAFDISMQPLWNVWTQARSQSRLPTSAELHAARQKVNWRAVQADSGRILLPRGMALSLNGIAQGYAAEVLRTQMKSMGIRHAMLDTGETAVLGQAPQATPWRFGIENVSAGAEQAMPRMTVPDGYALATSSDAHTRFTEDRLHHHILDPRTGDSPSWWSSVTVLARSAALADGLTKVFFMLPPARVESTARLWGVSVVLQDKQGQWTRAGTPAA